MARNMKHCKVNERTQTPGVKIVWTVTKYGKGPRDNNLFVATPIACVVRAKLDRDQSYNTAPIAKLQMLNPELNSISASVGHDSTWRMTLGRQGNLELSFAGYQLW